jgi:glycosyltransferase involved in cell wall biosynthesis
MKLVINIPCFNEEKTLGSVLQQLPKKLEGINTIEVLVIDDGSTDKTAKIAKEFGAKVITHKHNRGLGVAFRTGKNAALKAGADIIVTMDADGQFNPKDIPQLIKPILNQECDVVTVSRFLKDSVVTKMPLIRKFGNWGFTALVNKLTGQKLTDSQCGFRAYSREAAMRLNLKGKFTYTQEAFINLIEQGMKIKEIPSEIKYFSDRKSHISGKLVRYGFKSLGIMAKAVRDIRPLDFFGLPGMVSLTIGFMGGAYSLFYYATTLTTGQIKQLFNVSVFFMIFGVTLMVLALLADMMKTIISNQEEILYRLKKQDYKRVGKDE